MLSQFFILILLYPSTHIHLQETSTFRIGVIRGDKDIVWCQNQVCCLVVYLKGT